MEARYDTERTLEYQLEEKKINDTLFRFLKLTFSSSFYIFSIQVVISKASEGYK